MCWAQPVPGEPAPGNGPEHEDLTLGWTPSLPGSCFSRNSCGQEGWDVPRADQLCQQRQQGSQKAACPHQRLQGMENLLSPSFHSILNSKLNPHTSLPSGNLAAASPGCLWERSRIQHLLGKGHHLSPERCPRSAAASALSQPSQYLPAPWQGWKLGFNP